MKVFNLLICRIKSDHKVLRQSENLLSKPKNEENAYDVRELKYLRNENPYRVIISHINIKSIRNKFQSLLQICRQ